jgi:hypothetical protein
MTDELFHVEYSERGEEDMDEREVATAIALAAAAQYYMKIIYTSSLGAWAWQQQ